MWNKWWEKNIKVETGLCTLCPLHELLTHTHTHTETRTHSLSKSLTSSFLRVEKCWCVTCCWKPLSSYHHLSISSRPYIPLRAYHSGNSISCTNSATIPPENWFLLKSGIPRHTAFCLMQRKHFHILLSRFCRHAAFVHSEKHFHRLSFYCIHVRVRHGRLVGK